jgi:hypothetical protein
MEAFASMESTGESAMLGMAGTAVDASINVVGVVGFMMIAIAKVTPIREMFPVARAVEISIIKAMVKVAEENKGCEAYVER